MAERIEVLFVVKFGTPKTVNVGPDYPVATAGVTCGPDLITLALQLFCFTFYINMYIFNNSTNTAISLQNKNFK